MSSLHPVRIVLAFLAALASSYFAYDFVKNHAFATVDIVDMVVETDRDTLVRLYYGYGKQGKVEYSLENSQVAPAYAGARRTLNLVAKNKSISSALLEIENSVELTVHRIKIFNSISRHSEILEPAEIQDIIRPRDENASAELIQGELVIKALLPGAKLAFQYELRGQNDTVLWFITAIVFVVILAFGLRFDPLVIPAISDVFNRSSQVPGYRIELDGVRGIAALLVLLEHTWWRFGGSGSTGVWLFFALSGYLLSLPFVKTPSRALDSGYVVQYIFRRLARILPMYFFTLVLIFGVTTHSHLLLTHIFFVQAEGHLWTIPQEVFFYLALPFLMVAICFLQRIPGYFHLIALGCTTLLFLFNRELIGIELYGYSTYREPYLGWFLIGMFVAYLQPTGDKFQAVLTPTIRRNLSWAGIGLATVLVAASSSWLVGVVTGEEIRLPGEYKAVFAIACSTLILLILCCPDTPLSRLFSFTPLRAIGIVGYSYYLIHPLVIQGVMDFSQQYFNYELLHARLAVVTAIVTWLVCLFTYSLVERPFLLKKYQ